MLKNFDIFKNTQDLTAVNNLDLGATSSAGMSLGGASNWANQPINPTGIEGMSLGQADQFVNPDTSFGMSAAAPSGQFNYGALSGAANTASSLVNQISPSAVPESEIGSAISSLGAVAGKFAPVAEFGGFAADQISYWADKPSSDYFDDVDTNIDFNSRGQGLDYRSRPNKAYYDAQKEFAQKQFEDKVRSATKEGLGNLMEVSQMARGGATAISEGFEGAAKGALAGGTLSGTGPAGAIVGGAIGLGMGIASGITAGARRKAARHDAGAGFFKMRQDLFDERQDLKDEQRLMDIAYQDELKRYEQEQSKQRQDEARLRELAQGRQTAYYGYNPYMYS